MASANTTWQTYETGKSAKDMIKGKTDPLDTSISLNYAQQKSQNESHRTATEAQSSQLISGGTTTLIATGAGKESDINITGSDVLASVGWVLAPTHSIT